MTDKLDTGIGHYEKPRFDQFTPDQQAKLFADREKANVESTTGQPR
jgi:hypothetical protein